jgi:ABC-2 type transport system permease protein
MHNFFRVAKHEYLKRMGKKSFMVGMLGFPLMIVAIMALSFYAALGQTSSLPLGYIDHSGILTAGIEPEPKAGQRYLAMLPYASEESARNDLDAGKIQAYYVLPQDYFQTGQIALYYLDSPPGEQVTSSLNTFLKANLVDKLSPEIGRRTVDGFELVVRSMDGRQEFSSENFIAALLPFFGGFLFVIAVMTTSGYLLQVVTDEKENRTMEILLTSMSPEQLIGGKAAGLIALAFTLLLIWLAAAIAGLMFTSQFVPALEGVRIPWDFILLLFVYFVPSYVLMAGMMTAIGGSVTETRQGQQIAGMLNMLFMLPYFMTALIFTNPNSPLIAALTLFPTTSMVTITLRWGMTAIPIWQLVVSWILLTASAGFSIFASARIFRVGMLMYGQGLNLRAAWNAIRAR